MENGSNNKSYIIDDVLSGVAIISFFCAFFSACAGNWQISLAFSAVVFVAIKGLE